METVCKTCGKPPLATRAGSVTSYFFQHNYCQCHNKSSSSNGVVDSRARIADGAEQVCSNCGKSRPTTRRAGSLTAFLFKELRCTCAGSSSKLVGRSNSSFDDSSEGAGSRRRTKTRSRTAIRAAQRKQFTESFRKSKVTREVSANANSNTTSNATVLFDHGAVIGGAFRIDSMIGLGGMGVVYLAEQLSLKKPVALKILAPELVNEQSWQRFRAEAKTLAGLNHSSLVKVYDLGIHDNSIPYYSMDFLPGESLEEVLATTGPLELRQALHVFIEVLDGLAYAHRNGIIHRDIKPGNIMLCTIDGVEAVKILDFGISKLVGPHAASSQSLTAVGEIFGSPFYMSPEQCAGGAVDARSDIYSVGCTLIEALTGFVPFEGDEFIETVMMHQEEEPPRLSELNPDLKYPSSLDSVLAKCLAKRPSDRYQSAKEMAVDLTRVLEGKPVLANTSTDIYAKNSSKGSATAFATREASGGRENARKTSSELLVPIIVGTTLLIAIAGAVAFFAARPVGRSASVPPIISSGRVSTTSSTALADFELPVDGELKQVNDSAADEQSLETIADRYRLPQTPKGSEKETFMYSTSVVENGVKLRRFKFPTDLLIGKIQVGSDPKPQNAMGVIDIPDDAAVAFMPVPIVAAYPQYAKRFRLGDIDSLFIFVPTRANQVVAATANIPGIKHLNMSGSGDLTASGFQSVRRFKNLVTFSLVNSQLPGEALATADCWQHIEKIAWFGAVRPEAFLQKLQSCSQLTALTLSSVDLKSSDYLLVSKLTNLKTLIIPANTMTLEDLQAVASLPNVTYLDIHACGLGPRAIPILKKMPNLRELKMLRSNSSPEFKVKLIKGLPHVRVYGWADLK